MTFRILVVCHLLLYNEISNMPVKILKAPSAVVKLEFPVKSELLFVCFIKRLACSHLGN